MRHREKKGKCISFYSYKGGVGRTMTLVNLACLLGMQGKKVLVIDWDLEAPGLHNFFDVDKRSPGLVDLIYDFDRFLADENKNNELGYISFLEENFDSHVCKYVEEKRIELDIVKAGRFDENYSPKLQDINWINIYKRSPFLFRTFAEYLESRYDYILIDCRTGLSDYSGVTTMLLPQKLVLVFVLNNQNIDGVTRVAQQVIDYRLESSDFRNLDIFPLPSRVENTVSYNLSEWITNCKGKFERLFHEKYQLDECSLDSYFERVFVPYYPIYAHGENIPVLHESTGASSYISYYYQEFLSILIQNKPAWDVISANDEREQKRRVADLVKQAQMLQLQNDNEGLVSIFDQLIAIDSENHMTYFNRGTAKYLDGKLKDAIEDYDLSLSIRETSEAYYGKGAALVRLHNRNEALECYNMAIELDPSHVGSYNNRGALKAGFNDLQGALLDFRRAIEIQPEAYRAIVNLGRVYIKIGDYVGAIECLNKAIQLNPELPNALRLRAQAKYHLSDYQGGLADCQEATKYLPNDGKLLHLKGVFCAALGDLDSALLSFEQAIQCGNAQSNVFLNKLKNEIGSFDEPQKIIEFIRQEAIDV